MFIAWNSTEKSCNIVTHKYLVGFSSGKLKEVTVKELHNFIMIETAYAAIETHTFCI